MDLATEQQHAAWLRPDTTRMGNGYEPPFQTEDIGEMFPLPHGFDGSNSHRAAASYYSNTRAMAAGYGSAHGKNIVQIVFSIS